jgi:hypothetical protein
MRVKPVIFREQTYNLICWATPLKICIYIYDIFMWESVKKAATMMLYANEKNK